MRRVILLVSLAALCTAPLLAQEWSAAQKEVWKNVETYWELASSKDMEGFITYFHEDFSGWADGSPLPDSKDQRAKLIKYSFPKTTTLIQTLKPVAIKVHGNVAIVHYYYSMITKTDDGEETPEQGRWTDILMKQGNKWAMIGDHGGPATGGDD
jgi:ketosteroid isomerase-like protein